MASFILALLVLLAMVIMLMLQKDKEQADLPSLLNINSLLSILSTVFKTALLFPVVEGIGELKWMHFSSPRPLRDLERWNNASKTPWGSFKLILKHPTSFLTSLGAAVVVLSIAIDPFTQQVLGFYPCLQPISGVPARIPRTNNYTSEAPASIEGLTNFDGTLSAALYKGMLDPPENPSSLVNVFCPTGDCTFDETTSYSSLGVCPRVFDISDRMKGSLSMNKTSGDMSWNYTLPSGMEFSYDPSRPDRPVLTPLMATAGTMYNAAIELMMLAVDCVGGYDPNVPASQRGCSWKPRAFNISLYPCVYTYGNIRYERGVLVERTISTTPLGPTNGAYGLVGNYPSTPGTDCSGSPGSPQGSKTQRILTLDMVKGKRNTTYYDPDCVYEMAESRMDGLMLGLTRIFSWPEAPDKHLQRKFLSVWLVDGKGPDGMYMRLQTSEMYPELVGDEWLRTLWRNGTASLASVRNFMDGLAGTLTATIRQTGTSANSKPLLGVMYESRTCVSVNWSWLLYPAILLAFTSVFFILVMYRSHRYTRPGGKQSGRSAWKSSVLPLLWHGIQDSTRDAAPGSLDRFAVMEKYSDEVLVRIERRGWEMPLKGGPGDEQGLWFLRESNLPDY